MLIAQNMTFEKGIQIHEQYWFAEGIAEYIIGHSFYSKSEFMELCIRENLKLTGLLQNVK
jgi:hypothetical protein